MVKAPVSVEAYLAELPKEQRAALEKLRKQIRAVAPAAEEVISYHVPVFKLNGRQLVCMAAATNHCTFLAMSNTALAPFADELAGFELGKGSVRFTPDKPIPAALVKRIVQERIAENERRWGAEPPKAKTAKRTATPAPRGKAAEGKAAVDAFLAALPHPHKEVVEAVRSIIVRADKRMLERVKWNAPSFFHRAANGRETDFAAFNLRAKGFVQLILLFPNGVAADPTRLMQGDWKDRREARFTDLKDVTSKRTALTKVVKAWLAIMER